MSQYYDILLGVKSAAEAVLGSTPVRIRKRPFHSPDHGDTLPMLCLSPTAESVVERQMGNGCWVDYPVQLVLFQELGSTVADLTALQLQLDTRELIRLSLSKTPLPDVATVIKYAYDPSPAFDLGGLDNAYDLSCQLFTFRNNETRSA